MLTLVLCASPPSLRGDAQTVGCFQSGKRKVHLPPLSKTSTGDNLWWWHLWDSHSGCPCNGDAQARALMLYVFLLLLLSL